MSELPLNVFGHTDTGRARAHNEDAFACGTLADGAVWAVLCDGMGGAAAGDRASHLAAEIISGMITRTYTSEMDERSLRNLLLTAAANANTQIWRLAQGDDALAGMGTTAVAAIVRQNHYYLIHVGDSRAYLLVNGALRQLTRDHSMVQLLVDTGQIAPEEALTHPHRNLITRAVGVDMEVEPDFTADVFPEYGRLLLCSDGLTNAVDTEDIAFLLARVQPPDIPAALIDAANKAGGPDNITAVVIH